MLLTQVRKRTKQNCALDSSAASMKLKVELTQSESAAEADWRERLLALCEQRTLLAIVGTLQLSFCFLWFFSLLVSAQSLVWMD